MSKLLSSVLDKISENNNDYRTYLRTLNNSVDEKTTALAGDIVTSSNYTADFSNMVKKAKEKLSNQIARVIESYVIRDLRGVESVNEQFIEKINDKIESTNIESKEDKNKFTEHLNVLLNDKYLSIVKIKRTDFLTDSKNEEIEEIIKDFINELNNEGTFNQESLNTLFNNYKFDIYNLISKSLSKISDLYLNNFVDGVTSALNMNLDFDVDKTELKEIKEAKEKVEDFKPYIPEVNITPEINIPEEIEPLQEVLPPTTDEGVLETEKQNILTKNSDEIIDNLNTDNLTEEIMVKPVAPIVLEETKEELPVKKPYDVDEILKIAKSPVVSVNDIDDNNKKDNNYINVTKIETKEEKDTIDEFNAKEIVEEMIGRLSKRLGEIEKRQTKYDSDKQKIEEDEVFVNNLIKNSEIKKKELDKFEKELDEKEKELEKKEKELNEKINNVLPFANAVLKTEES